MSKSCATVPMRSAKSNGPSWYEREAWLRAESFSSASPVTAARDPPLIT